MAIDNLPTSATPSSGNVDEQAGEQPLPKSVPALRTLTWYELGRRMTSRTTDLLAIGIVVVVSLTMGRQILQWWGTDAPQVLDMGPLDNSNSEWGAGSRPVTLEFGNSPLTMTRQVIAQGGPQGALNAVREHCQQILVTAGPPDTPPDRAERDQLQALRSLTPDIEQPGKWQLFSLGGAMATVVGIKTFSGLTGNLDRASPSAVRRVICWGLVFPGLNQGSWTTYTFVRRQGGVWSASGFDLSQLALPAGCQRTVLMQEAGQTGLLGFQGRMDTAAWQSHFDRWSQAHEWTQVDPWTRHADGWSSRYVSHSANESTIQIQFHLQNSDQGVGLIHWLPGCESPGANAPSTSRGTP